MARTIEHPALAPLKVKFAQTRLLVSEFRDMVTLAVPREGIVPICMFLRDEPALRYDFLAELNGVDYLNYPGARHRFAVNYGLTSIPHNNRLWLRVFLDPMQDTSPRSPACMIRDEEVMDAGDPGLKVESVCSIWPGAEWMEREVYDMYGIIFTGHPDLRRIMTWNGFGSYPLRKDYPLRGDPRRGVSPDEQLQTACPGLSRHRLRCVLCLRDDVRRMRVVPRRIADRCSKR
jgi:NADH-quinone oxidoreductase subunit C